MGLFQIKASGLCHKLRQGMDLMHDQHIGRIILSLYQQPRNMNPRDNELHSIDFLYYPFEELFIEEKELITQGKDYNIVALVAQENEPIKYPADCIEIVQRTRLNPLHDSQHPEGPENYYSEKRYILLDDELKMFLFANHCLSHGWTPEILEGIFQKEIRRKQGIRPEYCPAK